MNGDYSNALLATLTHSAALGRMLSLVQLGTEYELHGVTGIGFHTKLDEDHIGRGGGDCWQESVREN